MAKYTIELGKLIELGYKLPLGDYPIFDEAYRDYLNRKIIDHYYFREIGLETPDRFAFYLRRTMNEVMPYYNELYKSQLMEFDPLASEFYAEGSVSDKRRDYKNYEHGAGKRGETTGDVFTSNQDTKTSLDKTTHATGNETGEYAKKGDRKDDTVFDKTTDTGTKRVDDLKQTETGQDVLTNALKETVKQSTTDNTLTTNNLHTKQVDDGTSENTRKSVGSNDTVFSDIPQAGIETKVVTAPDGTVTRTSKGYATTTTNEDTTENTTDKGKTHNQRDIDNTGTVKVDETGSLDSTKDNTGTATTDKTKSITNDNTVTGTENTVEHSTTGFTDAWNESGNDKRDTVDDYTEGVKTTANVKEDTQRNIANNSEYANDKTNKGITNEVVNNTLSGKGRKGVSPADLIMKYRESLINVDMMVIDELEKLFMGVY